MQLFMGLFLFPYIITEAVICDNIAYYYEEWRKRILLIGTSVNILANTFALFIIFGMVFSPDKPIKKFTDIITGQCTYQDISRVCIALAVFMAVSFLVGPGVYYYINRELPELSKTRKTQFLLLAVIMLIPVVAALKFSYTEWQNLTITEVCRKVSENTLEDAESITSYIVISNSGKLAYEADGIYFTDNEYGEEPRTVKNGVVPAGGSYTFEMAADKSLNIKKSGGTEIFLFDKFNHFIDRIKIPALNIDETYRLTENEWQVIDISKEPEVVPFLEAPSFSAEGGFYDEPFYLKLAADSGAKIYYTIDGSIPDENSQQYTGEIYVYNRSAEPNRYRSIKNVTNTYLENWEEPETVDKAFVVRAIAVAEDGLCSDVVTQTYFVDLDKYKDKSAVSLVADPDDLFGDEGIYVTGPAFDKWYAENLEKILQKEQEIEGIINELKANGAEEKQIKRAENEKKAVRSGAPGCNYEKRGETSERAANFELFDVNSSMQETLNQAVGIRIQGNTARLRDLKRFSIYARKEYSGSKVFDTEIFEGKSTHSVFLREGLDNSFTQMLVADRDIAVQQNFPVYVFLNGEYWYTTYLMEKYNDTYFAETYGVTKDNVYCESGSVFSAGGEYSDIRTFINNYDLSDSANYYRLCEIADIQSYIDWRCANFFMMNIDITDTFNVCVWKTYIKENDGMGDSRLRWGLYDMDLLGDGSVDRNIYSDEMGAWLGNSNGRAYNTHKLFTACRKNEDFRKQYCITLMDMINTNFTVENVSAVMENYGISIDSYKNGFYLNRAYYAKKHTAEEFELSGDEGTVTLSSNRSGAPIQLNTITPDLTDGWSGNYFTDYPVTATAVDDGFVHWEITAKGKTKTFEGTTVIVDVPKGGIEIRAVFK